MKKYVFIVLWGLLFVVGNAYAYTACPTLIINAACVDSKWQIKINPEDKNWELMGETVNGKSCSNYLEKANNIIWNYAAQHQRFGAVCNYTLTNNWGHQIGLMQIRAWKFKRVGNNWKSESMGLIVCRESQSNCLFSD